jgi:hypothetical protein
MKSLSQIVEEKFKEAAEREVLESVFSRSRRESERVINESLKDSQASPKDPLAAYFNTFHRRKNL